MKSLKALQTALAGLALLGMLSCSGGGGNPPPPPVATGLGYDDPDAPGFRLVRASDRPDILVLGLRGPFTEGGRGVTFGLQVDGTKAKFVEFSMYVGDPREYVKNNIFQLGRAPQIFKEVSDGNTLNVSLAQKGHGDAKNFGDTLVRVALQLEPNVPAGTPIAFSATDGARVLPGESGASAPITIAVGRLVAQ